MKIIRYLHHNDIDRQRWDACISAASNSLLYGYSWYLDVVTQQRWHALVYGDYEAVMPLPFARKWGLLTGFQPYFTQQLGVFSAVPLTPTFIELFVASIPKDFRLFTTHFNYANIKNSSIYAGKDFQLMPNYELHLADAYENIRRHYAKHTIRQLRKAAAADLIIGKNEDAQLPVRLFYAAKNTDLRLPASYYQLAQQIINTCIQHQKGEIWQACNTKKEVVAAAFFARDSKRIYNLLPAVSPEGKQIGAMFAIIDAVIRHYAQQADYLDFEGSAVAGVARFYESFGAKNCPYAVYRRNHLPYVLKKIYHFAKK